MLKAVVTGLERSPAPRVRDKFTIETVAHRLLELDANL
jgi:hypothetical protein